MNMKKETELDVLCEIRNLLKYQIRNQTPLSIRSAPGEGGPSYEEQEQFINAHVERAVKTGK